MGTKTMAPKTDAKMRRDVLDELVADSRVNAKELRVAVEHGVVTLNGVVDSSAARIAAQDAAHRVEGVLDVANDLDVRIPGTTSHADAEIAHGVRQALERNVLIPHQRLMTSVTNGIVTVEGSVESWIHYEDVQRAISALEGVREVRNRITVDPPTVTVPSLKRSITDALERHAAHAAKHVDIDIEGGVVTLTGHVPSWAERNAIEGAVRGTHGVRRVQNWIRIQA